MAITHLKTNISKFTNIVHLADVHVRLTKRHQEYREVFERMYTSLKTTPDTTAIFVLGDLFESKNDLSPECVDLVAEFLFNLASIRPTVLIAGNHDLLLTNQNRLDSLSPIVSALNHPNLFYLKKSGLYSLGNICINNYSVLDSTEKYLKGESIPQIYRNQYEHFVCLFHGQVDGATTELGFKLSNPTVPLSMFDGHDMALLGDIHLPQDLQIYDGTNPAVRFCGSFIQKNHAESIFGHGYSFWDLNTKTYKHVEIPNDYGFFTVDLKDGEIKTELDSLPKKSHIRFRLTNTPKSEQTTALLKIRQLTEVISSSDQKMDVGVPLTRIPSSEGNVALGNIDDQNYQVHLLKEYLKTKLKITDQSFIDGIIKINNEVNDSVKKDDFARNIKWIPIRFEWENMFSYGESNVIDFTKAKDLIGIFASNTAGKSTIFSALTFCLFDKCERVDYAFQVMNDKKITFNCKFEFEIDGKRYFIRREAKADKKGKVKVDVRFWKFEDGKEVDLNGEQRRNTNEIIREYLGTYDDFILTSLSVQNGKNNVSIIDMGDADRKDLFAQFMGLTVFDRLYAESNDRMRERLVALKTYKNEDFTQKLIDYVNYYDQAESLYREASEELSKLSIAKEKVNQDILETTKRLVKIEGTIPPINISNSELAKSIKNLAEIKNEILKKENTIELSTKKLITIETEIGELEKKKVGEIYEKFQSLLKQKSDIENKRERMKLNYLNDIKICEKAASLEYDPNCKFCVKYSGSAAEEADEARVRMKKIEESVNIIKIEMESIDTQIEETGWSKDAKLKLTDLLENRNDLKDSKITISGELNKLVNKLNKTEEEIKIHNKNIELYNKNIEAIQTNEEINKLINEHNKLLGELDYSLKKQNKTVMDINSKISVCKNHISEIENKIEKIKIVEGEYKLYEAYCQAVCRDGIPFDVITATIPEVQGEVNSILSQIADFTAFFEIDGKNIIPYIVYGDKKWLMSLSSGFEKFALSLAIRVALINISNLPRSNFLILDEGMGVMDAENLSSLPLLFTYLKSQFDFILIVSHLDALKDMVDNNIEITKKDGYSHVNYI